MIVAFCAVIAPGGYILFMLTVLFALRRPPAPPWVGEMLRGADIMQPWSMNEVMMLGILVALIKIAELATVNAGIGMYAVGGLVVLFPAIMVTFDPARNLAASPMGGRESTTDVRRSVRHRGSIQRSSRNQNRNRYFTTKVAKSTKEEEQWNRKERIGRKQL